MDDNDFPFWGIGSAAFKDIEDVDEPKEGDVEEEVDDGRDGLCRSLRESWEACF